MNARDRQNARAAALKKLPVGFGVYVLDDIYFEHLYVGKSVTSFKDRVSRHLTSARTDVIANRTVDPSEIARVRCYRVSDKALVPRLENYLIHHFNDISPLMNGELPARTESELGFELPEPFFVQVMSDEERRYRMEPEFQAKYMMSRMTEALNYRVDVKLNDTTARTFNVLREKLNRALISIDTI
mgnify:CR=1 FL=1